MTPAYSSYRCFSHVKPTPGNLPVPAQCLLCYLLTLLLQDSAEKDRRLRELSVSHESDMQNMEAQLRLTRLQLDSVRAE